MPGEGRRGLDAIIISLLNVAAGQAERTLTRSDLNEIIEEATAVSVPAVEMRSI